MKKYFKYVFLAVIIIITGFFNLNITSVQASFDTSTPILIRNLVLDTQGKTLLLDDSALNKDGKLTEYSDGFRSILKDWKVKYEKKGNARGVCEPPMINLSFDKTKTDSKGVVTARELFKGLTTYGDADNAQLQYQKIRLIPECDMWNDYFSGNGDVGFSGQLNVNLREYTISKIFRYFGVPTADIIGFANVTFTTPDTRYNGKSFRYMIIQRPQEQDDQIPFTTQFNLNSTVYESGTVWSTVGHDGDYFDEFTGGNIINGNTLEQVAVSLDPDTTLKFKLLTDFLNVGDMGFLHNEDGGVDKVTGKVKTIPHGFDYSFSCYIFSDYNIEHPAYNIENNIDELTRSKSSYQAAYYRIAQEIFGNKQNLDKMIAFVNAFPYTDVNKEKLLEYLKIRFYQYGKYFNSQEFADNLQQIHRSTNVILPFSSDEEYLSHFNAFKQACYRVTTPLTGVSLSVVGTPRLEISDSADSNGNKVFNSNFTVDVRTTDSALQVLKSNGAFKGFLVGEKENNTYNDKKNISFQAIPIYGVEDYTGPYYMVPPNTTARFNLLSTEVYENNFIKDRYFVKLSSFQPTNNISPMPLSAQSNRESFGTLDPIVVFSPNQGESLSMGSDYDIVWSATPDRYTDIYIVNENGGDNLIKYSSIYNGNHYNWKVGEMYYYNRNNLLTSSLSPGQYKFVVKDSYAGIVGESQYFEIIDPNNTTPTGASGLPVGCEYAQPVQMFSTVIANTPCLYSNTGTGTNTSTNTITTNRVLTIGLEGEDVRLVQQALQNAGYNLGTVDGSYGPLTAAAVRAFQADRGLPSTGEVDASTLEMINNIGVVPSNNNGGVIISNFRSDFDTDTEAGEVRKQTFNIRFDVTAAGHDVYIPTAVDRLDTATALPLNDTVGLGYTVESSSGNIVQVLSNNIISTESSLTSTANTDYTGFFTINEGETETFYATIELAQGNLAGFYHIQLTELEYDVDHIDNLTESKVTFSPIQDYETQDVKVDGAVISLPSVMVTSPNGGSFAAGSTSAITWTANNVQSTDWFKLFLVRPGTGLGETELASVASGLRLYSWNIPSTLGSYSDYKIRIKLCKGVNYGGDIFCTTGGIAQDDSDATFTISSSNTSTSTLTFSAPTLGQSGTQGKTLSIAWNTTNAPSGSYVDTINLWRGDTLVQRIISTRAYDASDFMEWGIPGTITPGDNYLIEVRVKKADGSLLVQNYSPFFRVIAPTATATPSITVLTPNEGSVYDGGPTQNINVSWRLDNGDASFYYVRLENVALNDYGYVVADNVRSPSNGATFQPSDTIINAFTQLSGKTREQLKNGYYVRVYAIKTSSVGNTYVANGQSRIFTITSTFSSCPLTYNCTPIGSTPTCRSGYTCTPVTVSCPSGYTCTTSTINTTPTSTITVTAPSAGQPITQGQSMRMAWTTTYPPAGSYVDTVNLFRGDAFVQRISSSYFTPLDEETWTMPSTMPIGDNYRIQVFAKYSNGSALAQTMSPYFRVVAAAVAAPALQLKISTPNGGEVVHYGDKLAIKWSQTGFTTASSPHVDVYIVPQDGRPDIIIASSISVFDGLTGVIAGIDKQRIVNGITYPLPFTPGTYRAKVVCQSSNIAEFRDCSDLSDGVFTIIDPLAFNTSGSAVLGAEKYYFTKFLEQGAYGEEVRELQKYLSAAGYSVGNIDGIFGQTVKETLMRFQVDNGLKSDGIVGYEVRTFLNK